MDIEAIWNYVADVNADTEADCPIRRLIAILGGHFLLYLHSTAHRPINAVEDDEQGVTCGIDEPTAMLGDSWVNQSAPESAEPI